MSRRGEKHEIIPDREYTTMQTASNVVRERADTIGDYIRKRRIASRLTQKELGELAGVGTRLISELERGKPTLRMDAVNKVLRVFGKVLGCVDAPRGEEGP